MTSRVLVVSGGLSEPSTTRMLADRLAAATERALQRDADADRIEVSVIELRDLARDITDALVTRVASPALQTALDAVSGAGGLIVVSPIFSASYSGLFKSFFDVLEPDALDGTPVLVAATGGTERHSLALEHALAPAAVLLPPRDRRTDRRLRGHVGLGIPGLQPQTGDSDRQRRCRAGAACHRCTERRHTSRPVRRPDALRGAPLR